jgi:hypothetical protein
MTGRDRRALVLGGLVVALALMLRGASAAHRWLRSEHERLAASAEVLARTQAEVKAAATLPDSAARLRERIVGLAPDILTGGSEPEAIADLTNRIGTIADDQAVKLVRAEALRDSARAGRLRRVSLRVHVESDADGTIALVRALEAGPTLLAVADLRILAADPFSPASAPEVLRSEVTARGWFLSAED